MSQILKKITHLFKKIHSRYITFRGGTPHISGTRDTATPQTREIIRETNNIDTVQDTALNILCSNCASDNFVKRGKRKKKHETVQLYLCRDCDRTFTSQSVKGRRFPLTIILEAITLYNLGYTLNQVSQLIQQKFNVKPKTSTISDWQSRYEPLCRYSRLRSDIMTKFQIDNLVEVTTMAHRQIYRFRYHRGKLDLILQERQHRYLRSLRDYLEEVPTDTPHQYFEQGLRISDIRSPFDKAQLVIKGKHNYANRLAELVLPTVRNNKDRHEAVQRFMLANDSVTVATEIPVYITQESISHLENQLHFNVLTNDDGIKLKGQRQKYKGRLLLTGHIDLIQVRNGVIHILDYKPQAARTKPIEQLTWYALALSRLTGLRLLDFKCAWFDEKEYFEFFPLHVVHKLKNKRRRKTVRYRSGERVTIPQEDKLTVVS